MIGTLFRFLILRVLGGRAAAVLAIIAVILGWRGRRADGRLSDGDGRPGRTQGRLDRTEGRFDRTDGRPRGTGSGRTTVPPGSTTTNP